MERPGCLIEQLGDKANIFGAMSIKRSGGRDEMVFNSTCALPLLRAFFEAGYGLKNNFNPDDSREIIRDCCNSCGNCSPLVTSDYPELRIERRGFSYTEARPAFEITGRYESIKSAKTVVIVDDEESVSALARCIATFGLTTVAVQVRRNAQADHMTQRALAALVEAQHPDCVVSDKGLGLLSGIELIKYLREIGIVTIMFTGEIQTDETRRVADVFLEKPMQHYELANAIMTSTYRYDPL